MKEHNYQQQRSPEKALELIEFTELAIRAIDLDDAADRILSRFCEVEGIDIALLYLDDQRLLSPYFYLRGTLEGKEEALQQIVSNHYVERLREAKDGEVPLRVQSEAGDGFRIVSHLLKTDEAPLGILGTNRGWEAFTETYELWGRYIGILSGIVDRLIDQEKIRRQLTHQNTYVTISSMLAQSLGLHDLLEVALYGCMEVVSAEAASVLLLDDEKKNLNFYQVEGPAKPVLMTATIPSDQGLAGSILEKEESEIINDVQQDPRFFGKIDEETGFITRNMIAIPLIAGKEKVGVLEVLNKTDGEDFTEEEHLHLLAIAEEIAFAIRNARVFEYVVNSYCKQRQGESSCKGCERPLGSWTPCVKYREVTVLPGRNE